MPGTPVRQGRQLTDVCIVNMHLNRWITSIVALPILGLVIFKGGAFLFAVLIAAVALVVLWEYFRISMSAATPETRNLMATTGFILTPMLIWAAYQNEPEALLGLVVLDLIVCGFISLLRFKSDPNVTEAVARQVAGLIYVPVFLSSLVLLRNSPAGILWVVLLLCVVFAGDVAAYYVGSHLGRHKLCPSVSPGKTVEGAVGGLAASVAVGVLIWQLCSHQIPWGWAIVFFAVAGVAGQMGDLFESVLKRSAGIKDSGSILPGHGGLLDRIDALLFAAPIALLFKEYLL